MISVENYNENWPLWFQQLHSEIWPSVQDFALAIEHVGSTSVPGLAAKPVIDIDVVVENESKLHEVIYALVNLGYEHRGNMGIEGREAFRSPNGKVKHNLYACIQNCTALKNHITLRDHLRKFPQAREEYSALKRRLALEFSDSIDGYVDGKTDFIISIISNYGMSETELSLIDKANRAPAQKYLFKEISIGGLSKEQLIGQLVAAGIQFNKYANTLFEHPSFSPDEQVSIVKLAKVNLSDLNMQSPCSFQNIVTRAACLGLKTCPLYLGAFLRLQYLNQLEGSYLTIVSPRPENDEAYPTGFYVRNFNSSLWLRGYRVDGEPEWPAENEFVFII